MDTSAPRATEILASVSTEGSRLPRASRDTVSAPRWAARARAACVSPVSLQMRWRSVPNERRTSSARRSTSSSNRDRPLIGAVKQTGLIRHSPGRVRWRTPPSRPPQEPSRRPFPPTDPASRGRPPQEPARRPRRPSRRAPAEPPPTVPASQAMICDFGARGTARRRRSAADVPRPRARAAARWQGRARSTSTQCPLTSCMTAPARRDRREVRDHRLTGGPRGLTGTPATVSAAPRERRRSRRERPRSRRERPRSRRRTDVGHPRNRHHVRQRLADVRRLGLDPGGRPPPGDEPDDRRRQDRHHDRDRQRQDDEPDDPAPLVAAEPFARLAAPAGRVALLEDGHRDTSMLGDGDYALGTAPAACAASAGSAASARRNRRARPHFPPSTSEYSTGMTSSVRNVEREEAADDDRAQLRRDDRALAEARGQRDQGQDRRDRRHQDRPHAGPAALDQGVLRGVALRCAAAPRGRAGRSRSSPRSR